MPPELYLKVVLAEPPDLDQVPVGNPYDRPGAKVVPGTVSYMKERLRFRPRDPFLPGVDYAAIYDLHSLDIPNNCFRGSHVFRIPVVQRDKPTTVAAIYPSARELPENVLKFYLHFSAPMGRGDAYEHIRLLDDQGRPLERTFLGEELWNADQTRLTLLFNPGRIKRGLVPHEEEGPPLLAGHTYTLVVDASWRDAEGRPLGREFRQTFRTTAADRTPPDPDNWKVSPPAASGRDPLTLRFPEPLDHALLHRMIRVIDAAGQAVKGEVSVRDGETTWAFTPEKPWAAGKYQFRVDPALEDRAGNRIRRPFDLGPDQKSAEPDKPVAVPFEVK